MDSESSTKFIGSLTKFLQSLCNGYVEFDDGVELIGHIYLSVDAGKSGKTLNYFLNEKVCKNDNSVTFISNSFHAQPEGKSKAASGKDEGRREDGDVSDSGDNTPRSTNAGTILSRPQAAFRSAASPNQNRTGVHIGTKRPGSPLKGPAPQRRAPTPPSRRLQSSGPRGTVGSPVSKTVPSSPSSSSQDNVPSPSPARKSRNEVGQPTSNQSDNVNTDNESDIVPPNVLSINPTPEFASFLGSLTSDNQTSQDQSSPPDTKPDTDVTFIKEEFVSEPSSCAQTGSSGQHSGRSGEDNSGLYPVMLHQNTSVFPSTSAGYPAYQGGASATATSQPAFPGTSSSQSDPFNPVPGTSQDGADPSAIAEGGGNADSVFVERPDSMGYRQAEPLGRPDSMRYRQAEPLGRPDSMGYRRAELLGRPDSMGYRQTEPVGRPDSLGYSVWPAETGLSIGKSPWRAAPKVGVFHHHSLPDTGEENSGGQVGPHGCGCGEAFRSGFHLYEHMRTAHKLFLCIQCNQSFSSAANLSYHRNKEHGHNSSLQCTHCGKFFGHRQNLRVHLMKAHKGVV